MNRNLYLFGIFLIGLAILASAFQFTLQIDLGDIVLTGESFLTWFFLLSIINIGVVILLVKYFYHKGYMYLFYVGLIDILETLIFCIIVYNVLVNREMEYYYMGIIISHIMSLLISLGLVFSDAREKPWLKAAGYAGMPVFLILLIATIWALSTGDLQVRIILGEVYKWISLAGLMLPVFLIMNFISELKSLNVKMSQLVKPGLSGLAWIVVAVLLVSLTIYLGNKLAKKSYASYNKKEYWKKRNYEKAKKLTGIFDGRYHVNKKGDSLRYRLLKPLNYDPAQKYPLVVILHDGGFHGTDNISQLACQPTPTLSSYGKREKYPAFLFVPHCPEGATWSRNPHVPSMDSLVFETIAELEKEFEIDTKRRYVIGGSGGGFGSWHFICMHPEMFAAAIPMCGGGDPELAHRIADVPVWAFHGLKDEVLPVKHSREMIEAIRKAGGDPKYTEFPNGVHNVWPELLSTPGVWDWFFSQERE